MRKTINRPNYLNKQRIIDGTQIFRPSRIINTNRVIEPIKLLIPTFTYCPIMGTIYSLKVIYL